MATTREEAANAEIAATGKRWCSACQMPKLIEEGVKSPRMWRCKGCEEQRKARLKRQHRVEANKKT